MIERLDYRLGDYYYANKINEIIDLVNELGKEKTPKMIHLYKCENIEKMSKDRLIEVVIEMGQLLNQRLSSNA